MPKLHYIVLIDSAGLHIVPAKYACFSPYPRIYIEEGAPIDHD